MCTHTYTAESQTNGYIILKLNVANGGKRKQKSFKPTVVVLLCFLIAVGETVEDTIFENKNTTFRSFSRSLYYTHTRAYNTQWVRKTQKYIIVLATRARGTRLDFIKTRQPATIFSSDTRCYLAAKQEMNHCAHCCRVSLGHWYFFFRNFTIENHCTYIIYNIS